ncbi:MAG: hypothetical protein KTR25_07230 [Myxococcales bacterium]|nr:hypothetical protein [Myxococcales bacterium]
MLKVSQDPFYLYRLLAFVFFCTAVVSLISCDFAEEIRKHLDQRPDSPLSRPEKVTLTLDATSSALISVFPETASIYAIEEQAVLQSISNDRRMVPAISAFLNYSVKVGRKGHYALRVQYAFGGTETNLRDAWLYVNGVRIPVDDDDVLEFAYTGIATGKWNTLAYTPSVRIPLRAGDNDIRLVAINDPSYKRAITYTRTGSGGTKGETGMGTVTGLPNIAALEVGGRAPIEEGTGRTTLYSLSVRAAEGEGYITVSPKQYLYSPGTLVRLGAAPQRGFRFDSWTGDSPSTSAEYSFRLGANTQLKARFIPGGAQQPPDLVGFGALQSDSAVQYTLSGGYGGETITVQTLNALQEALATAGSRTIKISGLIDNSDAPSLSLNVPSNTTVFGDPHNYGHLKNVELKLSGRNYIVRNLILSEVVAVPVKNGDGVTIIREGRGNDIININGGKNIWIDHCELYSSLSPELLYDFSGPEGSVDGVVDEYDAKDFYDGLIDIKNGATFISISHNYFHNHWKAILIGSSDTEENGDSLSRITIHHNFFENIISRIPSLRYGKGHFYNNYVTSTYPVVYGEMIRVESIVNLRNGAEALVENNIFQGTLDTVGYFYGNSNTSTGYWTVSNNVFVDVENPQMTSNGYYTVPYNYLLENTQSLYTTVPEEAGVGVLTEDQLPH